MKKSEQVTRIIKQLNETIVLKATAIKNQNFSEAGNLRYKERKLTERFRKLTGRLPEKDEKKVYIEKPLNPEVEQKHWNDLHATAHRQEPEVAHRGIIPHGAHEHAVRGQLPGIQGDRDHQHDLRGRKDLRGDEPGRDHFVRWQARDHP